MLSSMQGVVGRPAGRVPAQLVRVCATRLACQPPSPTHSLNSVLEKALGGVHTSCSSL